MKLQSVSMLVLLFALSACGQPEHQIVLKEMGATTVMFDVINRSKADAEAMTFELTYLSANDSTILVDTVEFTKRERDGTPGVFLKAGESTFFAQRFPEGTTTASGRIISYR